MIKAENFYTNNFQKASRLPLSRQKMEAVVKQATGKDLQTVTKMIEGNSAKVQFMVLASLYCVAVEKCQQPRDLDPADGIIWNLGKNISKYGDKAFPLSEAQIKLALQRMINKI